jgi:hypothetical protein
MEHLREVSVQSAHASSGLMGRNAPISKFRSCLYRDTWQQGPKHQLRAANKTQRSGSGEALQRRQYE